MGFFNAAGHLRFYRHVLLFPYYDITGAAPPICRRAPSIPILPYAGSLPRSFRFPAPSPCPTIARVDGNRARYSSAKASSIP